MPWGDGEWSEVRDTTGRRERERDRGQRASNMCVYSPLFARPGTAIYRKSEVFLFFWLDSHQHKVASGGISLLQARGEDNGRSENRPGHCLRRHVYWTIGKSASTPSALWIIIPVMPIMAARPLLRSALSLNFFTSGSEYLRRTGSGAGQPPLRRDRVRSPIPPCPTPAWSCVLVPCPVEDVRTPSHRAAAPSLQTRRARCLRRCCCALGLHVGGAPT